MENVPLSAADKWPHRAALIRYISILLFLLSRLTTLSTNNYTFHNMHFISSELSLHTTIFDFIVRKGVPLIMVIRRTITGVQFPSAPCEPQIACPPQSEP